ncbi:halocyanin, partial [Haloferax denitrificans ATCC 35960]
MQTTGLAVATAGLAGCNGQSSDDSTTAAGTDSETETADGTTTEDAESSVSVDATVAVAAEWNAMRARLYDTVALAAAGRLGTAARVTGDAFARFEQSSGEWGAHEQLEATNEQNYETFESHLGGAREAYAAGDAERGADLAVQAADNLLAAQRGRVDAAVVDALGVLLFGARARDAGLLAAAGEVDAAAELANAVYEG